MKLSASEIVASAKELRESFAGANLPRPFAKLYSQYTQLSFGLSGLQSWQADETSDRLNDAVGLLNAAFIERDAGGDNWRDSARRAGALLEWLSHPQLNRDRLPLTLLAAAAYQLAGYPALSSGLLDKSTVQTADSQILYFLLKADFPKLLEQIVDFWRNNLVLLRQARIEMSWQNHEEISLKLQLQIVKETASALGILCTAMRWGDTTRIQPALKKLSAIEHMLLNGHDSYSWLLARLCSEVAKVYVQNSLRGYIGDLSQGMSGIGRTALERYLRQCFQQNKTIAWSSQILGIERLTKNESFVLCTPTGSGKTTIAELAILQNLFFDAASPSEPTMYSTPAPIVLYLVPSRALAAEVEANLSRVLRNLNEPPINVTGLYGGTDWGPTDAWLTADIQTVLICTYEKAEALIRFLSPLFLKRVSLVVIDEAHSIQFNGKIGDLRKAESRSLRLESLGARLFAYLDQSNGKVIALSAVASRMQNTLAQWVTGNGNAIPVETRYRSTRQLIGRLECNVDRNYVIRYDLLDGADLQFDRSSQINTPYIIGPFDACPPTGSWGSKSAGPEKRLRPYLLWAAMQLGAQYYHAQHGAVLISVMQFINTTAGDFLTLLNQTWRNEKMPVYFSHPQNERKKDIWKRCLNSCEDYFGRDSNEYRLLEIGIVVHHGKMPGLMARLLIQVIQERIVHVVLATSTLSEGVNLPIETVIIPSILRSGERISPREFSNLIGRAGRPGIGTEGRSLILLENDQGRSLDNAREIRKTRRRYFDLIGEIKGQIEVTDKETGAQSSLAVLLKYLEDQWVRYFSNTHLPFFSWLEMVTPLHFRKDLKEEEGLGAIEAVDTLDSVLLSVITELEQIDKETFIVSRLEDRLRQIWQKSYAYYAMQEEKYLDEIFIRRGKALQLTIYPDRNQRRRLYRTSLPPRSGNELLRMYSMIIEVMKKGDEYAIWSNEKRFQYVQTILENLGTLPTFELKNKSFGRKEIAWKDILRWWLDPASNVGPKTASEISIWYDYVSENFVYKICWGLGSIIALAGDDVHSETIMESALQDWPLLDLPWVIFWLKELLTWGTLEPVAAYLLAKNIETTRKAAEEDAKVYYNDRLYQVPDSLLNASEIRRWAESQYKQARYISSGKPSERIKVRLLRNFTLLENKQWRVVPVESEDELRWFDPGGFPFAVCRKPSNWKESFVKEYDFILDTSNAVITSNSYLQAF